VLHWVDAGTAATQEFDDSAGFRTTKRMNVTKRTGDRSPLFLDLPQDEFEETMKIIPLKEAKTTRASSSCEHKSLRVSAFGGYDLVKDENEKKRKALFSQFTDRYVIYSTFISNYSTFTNLDA
jgi:hypothetical protein